MASVNPNYDSVAKSGVASKETPGAGYNLPGYAKCAKSGVAVSSQPDAPPFPEDTPTMDRPYNSVKN